MNFWDKTSKTMAHVDKGFKGYQYYEFNHIKVALLLVTLEGMARYVGQLLAPEEGFGTFVFLF